MDERVAQCRTAAECEQLALNVEKRDPGLAMSARNRAIDLKADTYGARNPAERDAIAAVYAYERVRSQVKGKAVHASRTWQMIKRHGIIPAVERIVTRPEETIGYTALLEMDLKDKAFEAVVLRHQELFSERAIERSRKRLDEWDERYRDRTRTEPDAGS